ncbi:type II toxin-antitoxin system RelE/ParE family toxin [Candidatus Microgenomates bacterium]|nr:type II toxin-antitoxin system RelE/ParE family toxin [Candidatus Microgenomates bacterium]
MEETAWNIETYETASGEKIVDEFIKKQQPQTIAKIAHDVKLLKQYGNKLGLPHSKALGAGLYELRIRGREEIRILYCFRPGKTIYLLHGFKKQTKQIPLRELDVALQRMKDLTSI